MSTVITASRASGFQHNAEWKPSARDRLVARAYWAVHIAISRCRLPEIESCRCVDCGAPAECYDHRDYTKPLQVEPVCKGCNNRRGPGLPLPSAEDGGYNKIPGKTAKRWQYLEGDAEGAQLHEYPILQTLNWRDLDEQQEIARELDRTRGAVGALSRRNTTISLGRGRDNFFKARDPWGAR